MRRLFWLGIGVAVGVVVVRQIGKAAQAYSPSGLAGTARNSAASIVASVRDFVADVRDGMSQRRRRSRPPSSRASAWKSWTRGAYPGKRNTPTVTTTGEIVTDTGWSWGSAMKTAEIKRRFLAHFEANGHRSCRRPAARHRLTRTCCSSTPAWCSSCRTSWGRRPRRTEPAVSACRSASARRTSTRSARPAGTARSSR